MSENIESNTRERQTLWLVLWLNAGLAGILLVAGSIGDRDQATGHDVPGAGQALSGTAYTDENGNGRQDPGEPNLVSQRVQVTLRDGTGKVTNQVVQTDATGRYSAGGSTQDRTKNTLMWIKEETDLTADMIASELQKAFDTHC